MEGIIWCYSCKHRGGDEYNAYCEGCSDAWSGYESDEEDEEEEES